MVSQFNLYVIVTSSMSVCTLLGHMAMTWKTISRFCVLLSIFWFKLVFRAALVCTCWTEAMGTERERDRDTHKHSLSLAAKLEQIFCFVFIRIIYCVLYIASYICCFGNYPKPHSRPFILLVIYILWHFVWTEKKRTFSILRTSDCHFFCLDIQNLLLEIYWQMHCMYRLSCGEMHWQVAENDFWLDANSNRRWISHRLWCAFFDVIQSRALHNRTIQYSLNCQETCTQR